MIPNRASLSGKIGPNGSSSGFAGYRCLLGPEQLRFHGGGVVGPELYYLWHLDAVTSRGGKPWDAGRQAIARVNHGRWLADCVWCRTGMLTRPSWGVAYCAECGARYEGEQALVFPVEHAKIEKALVCRVRRDQQNWDSRQSATELEAENEQPEVVIP